MSLDIQLLKAFQALDRSGTVTAASKSLGITQPSLSYLLAQLRAHYSDPLFVRTGNRLTRTPLATALCSEVDRLLLDFERVQSMTESFEAASSTRTFRIHMIDVAELTLLPRLLHALAGKAPRIGIDVIRNSGKDIWRQLQEGHLDLAVGTPWGAEKGLYRQRLLEETYVGIVRKGHPFIRQIETVEGFLRCGHCSVKPTGPIHARVEGGLSNLSAPRRVVLQVPDFLSVPRLVASSDLVAAVPGDLARMHARELGLQIFRLPIPSVQFSVMQHWHKRLHRDRANQWLRLTTRQAVAGVYRT